MSWLPGPYNLVVNEDMYAFPYNVGKLTHEILADEERYWGAEQANKYD